MSVLNSVGLVPSGVLLALCHRATMPSCHRATVPSYLMADWNVVSNPEFFMLFHKSFHIFYAKIISECAIFYSLSTSAFKTEASFNDKISFMSSGEKVFKSLSNSIVRRCEIF